MVLRSTFSLSLLATAASFRGALGFGVPVPNRYVVEIEDSADLAEIQSKFDLDEVEIKMDYNFTLFKGASIELKNATNAEALIAEIQALNGINTWQVKRIPRPDAQVKWAGNPEAQFSSDKLAPRDSNSTSTAYGGLNIDSTHDMTQVTQLRQAGYTGKGVKVAVIDTGIDYLHPALGGCIGEGCLVTHGYDFVGDEYSGDGLTLPVPDDDPMDCGGHGTHVAGIVAAQANSFGFTGGAPNVTLGAYKVFGCDGSVENDVLIAAFNQAYEDGSDIITASIGGPSGWSEDPWAVAVERIVAKGVPCTLAAGNEGSEGMFYAATASSGKKVFSVGSIDNINTPTLTVLSNYSINGAATVDFDWTDGKPYSGWGSVTDFPLWSPGINSSSSDGLLGCSEDDYANAPDLSNKVALIKRGTCTFVAKAQLAANHGAKFIIVWNNVAGMISVDVTDVSQIEGVGMIATSLGQTWVDAITAGKEVTVNMVNPDDATPVLGLSQNNATGGSMSDYTTWGPTWEMDTRPVFAAPGGDILSTYPRAKGSFAVLSGTSMATPLVCAIVALIGEARGTFDPSTIENLLANYASPVEFNYGSAPIGYLAPIPQQGAGLVKAYDAAFANSTLSRQYISFNDTQNFVNSTEFEIVNLGSSELTYTIGHSPALTAFGKSSSSDTSFTSFPNGLSDDYATLTFSETTVTVAAGEKKSITVSAAGPVNVEEALLPVWSGYITVNVSDSTSMILPYQGMSAALHDVTQIEESQTFLTEIPSDEAYPFDTYEHTSAAANSTWVLPAPGTNNASALTAAGVALPGVQIDVVAGSALLRADLVPLFETDKATEVLGYKVIGQHYSFPQNYITRGSVVSSWNGLLADGSYAPAGQYKWAFRTLKIFGDASKEEDYQTITSVPFSISYASSNSTSTTRRRSYPLGRYN